MRSSRPGLRCRGTRRLTHARDRLRAFDTIAPLDPPPSFTGTLREYQREGLGWLAFLREFGFGGCLADDMGLGKTVVVLALLDARRQARETAGRAPRPSLVVVPRSVLFNWQQEAARFAPRLRVLDFSGAGRTRPRASHRGERPRPGHLRHAPARRRGTWRRRIRLRHPRRGADDQEREHGSGEGRAPAARDNIAWP